MGGPKVKLWFWVVGGGGGARCQFVKHRRGLQAILMFKWYIIYSSSTSSLLNDF